MNEHSFTLRCQIAQLPFILTKADTFKIIVDAVNEAIALVGSQYLLARKSNLSQATISKYIRGKAKPRGEVALALEEATNFKVHRSRFAPHIFSQD